MKKNWIKVRYQHLTKRLNNAPLNLDELKIVLWNRFGSLRDNLNDPGSLIISAELPRSAGDRDQSIENSQMPLTSSEDLESFIYQTHQERGVCARLTISMASESTENTSSEAMQALPIQKKQPRMTSKNKSTNIFNAKGNSRRSSKRSSQKTDENNQSLDFANGASEWEMPAKEQDHLAKLNQAKSKRAEPGMRDERMSWGLKFYEQQEMVNRAHFPDIYSKSQHSQRGSHDDHKLLDSSSEDEESDQLSGVGRIKNN